MAVTTVRPNGVASGAGSYTISGGSATTHAALSDDSDSTFITKSTGVTGQASVVFDFGTTSISASQRVKRVRIRGRLVTPTAAGRINLYLGSRIDNENYYHSAFAIRGLNSITTFVSAWWTSSPDGSDWNQASINGLRAKVTEYNDTTDCANVYELYVDVDVAAQPTVTVSAPTGTITNSAAPDVTWAFADSDGETQSYYQLKVFTAAQYGAGGFSALTSTAEFDSGEIGSTDNASVVGVLLNVGTYRAYVRVAKAVNGQPFWSDYAFSQFTLSFTPPSVPTMVVEWSDTLGKASFTLTGTSPSGYTSQYYDVNRSDDDGVIYESIRDGDRIIPNASFIGTAVDYEAPRDTVAYYRCRSVGVDASSNEFPSAWGTVQQVLITNDETWWFKVIEEPEYNLGSVRVLADLDVTIEEPNIVFRPLGSTRPIVVAGPLQGEDGIYNVKTINEAEWDDFYLVLTHQGTLLVQDPLGNQKYVRITDRTWVAETVSGAIHRNIEAAYVEVDE
jgi:hypothetical protein